MVVRFTSVPNIVHEIDSIFHSAVAPYPFMKQLDRNNRFAGVSMRDTGDHVSISMELPGVTKQDVSVSINDGQLTITAERKRLELKENEQWLRNELNYGKIERTIELPYTVDVEKVSAVHENGILSIVLPKHEAVKPKQITIR
jgi:HSP20 family protein